MLWIMMGKSGDTEGWLQYHKIKKCYVSITASLTVKTENRFLFRITWVKFGSTWLKHQDQMSWLRTNYIILWGLQSNLLISSRCPNALLIRLEVFITWFSLGSEGSLKFLRKSGWQSGSLGFIFLCCGKKTWLANNCVYDLSKGKVKVDQRLRHCFLSTLTSQRCDDLGRGVFSSKVNHSWFGCCSADRSGWATSSDVAHTLTWGSNERLFDITWRASCFLFRLSWENKRAFIEQKTTSQCLFMNFCLWPIR